MIRKFYDLLNRRLGQWVKIDWDDIHDSPTTEEIKLANGREHG